MSDKNGFRVIEKIIFVSIICAIVVITLTQISIPVMGATMTCPNATWSEAGNITITNNLDQAITYSVPMLVNISGITMAGNESDSLIIYTDTGTQIPFGVTKNGTDWIEGYFQIVPQIAPYASVNYTWCANYESTPANVQPLNGMYISNTTGFIDINITQDLASLNLTYQKNAGIFNNYIYQGNNWRLTASNEWRDAGMVSNSSGWIFHGAETDDQTNLIYQNANSLKISTYGGEVSGLLAHDITVYSNITGFIDFAYRLNDAYNMTAYASTNRPDAGYPGDGSVYVRMDGDDASATNTTTGSGNYFTTVGWFSLYKYTGNDVKCWLWNASLSGDSDTQSYFFQDYRTVPYQNIDFKLYRDDVKQKNNVTVWVIYAKVNGSVSDQNEKHWGVCNSTYQQFIGSPPTATWDNYTAHGPSSDISVSQLSPTSGEIMTTGRSINFTFTATSNNTINNITIYINNTEQFSLTDGSAWQNGTKNPLKGINGSSVNAVQCNDTTLAYIGRTSTGWDYWGLMDISCFELSGNSTECIYDKTGLPVYSGFSGSLDPDPIRVNDTTWVVFESVYTGSDGYGAASVITTSNGCAVTNILDKGRIINATGTFGRCPDVFRANGTAWGVLSCTGSGWPNPYHTDIGFCYENSIMDCLDYTKWHQDHTVVSNTGGQYLSEAVNPEVLKDAYGNCTGIGTFSNNTCVFFIDGGPNTNDQPKYFNVFEADYPFNASVAFRQDKLGYLGLMASPATETSVWGFTPVYVVANGTPMFWSFYEATVGGVGYQDYRYIILSNWTGHEKNSGLANGSNYLEIEIPYNASFQWQVCASDSVTTVCSSNSTFSISEYSNPSISVAFTSPTTTNSTLTTNINYIEWNMTVSDDAYAAKFQINGTNQTATCINASTSTYCYYNETGLIGNVTRCAMAWANNGTSVIASNTSVCISTDSEIVTSYVLTTTYNINTSEYSNQRLITNINFTNIGGVTSVSGNLIYDGTTYAATATQGGNGWQLSKSLTMSTIPSGSEYIDKQFSWNFTIDYVLASDATNQTSNLTQNIYKIIITNCSNTSLTNTTTLQFYLRDERTGDIIDINGTFSGTFNAYVGSSYRSYSFDMDNSTYYRLCIYPYWAQYNVTATIEYNATGYTQRAYILSSTTINSTSTDIDLFLLPTTYSGYVIIYVRDSSDSAVSSVFVTIQRYDISSGTYSNVTTLETDDEGKVLAALELNDVYYRFWVTNSIGSTLKVTNKQVIPDTLNAPESIYIWLSSSLTEWLQISAGASYNCTIDKTVNTTYCMINDNSGLITSSCLKVQWMAVNGFVTICDSCNSTVPISSLTCSLGMNANGTYGYQYYVTALSGNKYNIETGTISYPNASIFGDMGLLLTIFMVMAMVMMGLWRPEMAGVLAVVAIIISQIMGIMALTVSGVLGLLIMAVFMAYYRR